MEDTKAARKRQFAAVLAQARIARDMTQNALADAVGCNVRLVGFWEAGASLPGWEFTRRLSLTLGLNGDQLLLLERASVEDTLPAVRWEATREALLELEESLRDAMHHATDAMNVLGRPPGAEPRTNGAIARDVARRRSAKH